MASKEGLGRIASSLGRPLCMDFPTKQGTHLGVAKLCVEISVKSNLVNKLSITPDDCPEMFVDIDYFHVPSKCEKCQVFGHECSNLGGTTKKVWVVKQPRVKELDPVGLKDKGKGVMEEPQKEVTQEVGAGTSMVVDSSISSPDLVQDRGAEPSVVDDIFQVVTHRKNRVRAPAPGFVPRSRWSLSAGSRKSPFDDQAFHSLSRPVLKRPVEPPPVSPARGKGSGKKRGK
ncbi:unnamed protein product [Linum trigynum]|uniref:Uncharacterized protein n=1 Tax=Linum trigynum TaxID=586398 RepID=A0AAV2E034_9ROSI